MKLYQHQDKNKLPKYDEEFADEFSELENERLQEEIDGPLSKKISDIYKDPSILENFPF
ncbi:MAG: hypothetical protein FWE07_01720 [Turicibacter sp.]|nr:hypothetical protein [Turicibacter sp.]